MALNGASDFTIQGGAHNVVYGNQHIFRNSINTSSSPDDILRHLAEHAAINACHDAEQRYPPPSCHPNTRVAVLNKLGQWVEKEKQIKRVCWVHGSAGVGKSAIAQKISEDHIGRVVGSFFFSRNDTTRDRLDPFVATIAYQCCISDTLKDAGRLIIEAIRSNPTIFQTSFENQFRKLLLEPFSKVKHTRWRKSQNLIIIDGIDECIDISSQRRLLRIIDSAITFSTPSPFIFLLCSRLEPNIRDGIDNAAFASCLDRIPISGTTIRFLGYLSESDLDIQRYLVENFALLRRKYHSALQEEGESWPGEHAVGELVWRASGQFIFAVTVIKYIDTDDERPQERLKTILSTQPGDVMESPYSTLDLLYQQILSKCRHWDQVFPVLRLLVTPHPTDLHSSIVRWHSPTTITGLLKLNVGEVQTLLSRLHSVLHIPEDDENEVHVLHASFSEFLLNRSRSGVYHILAFPRTEYCALVAELLLRTLKHAFQPLYPPYRPSIQSFNDSLLLWQNKVNYIGGLTLCSLEEWYQYCVEVVSPSASLLAELDAFDPYVVGSVQLPYERDIKWIPDWFEGWMRCLTWAKSLVELTPRKFVETLEQFRYGFRIACGEETAPRLPILEAFELDFTLVNLNKHTSIERRTFASFISTWYQDHRRWTERSTIVMARSIDMVGRPEEETYFPMLLPTCSAVTIPGHWVMAHITQSSGNTIKNAYEIYQSLDERGRSLFDQDVLLDASDVVHENLVEEAVLNQLKALVHERGKTFAPLSDYVPQSNNQRISTTFDDTRAHVQHAPSNTTASTMSQRPTKSRKKLLRSLWHWFVK